jgi:hypothetical protein
MVPFLFTVPVLIIIVRATSHLTGVTRLVTSMTDGRRALLENVVRVVAGRVCRAVIN